MIVQAHASGYFLTSRSQYLHNYRVTIELVFTVSIYT